MQDEDRRGQRGRPEGESNKLEVTAGYSLQKNTGLLRSMTDSVIQTNTTSQLKALKNEIIAEIKEQKNELGGQIKELGEQVNELVEQIKELGKEFGGRLNKLETMLYNDRARKKNDDGYSKYLQNTHAFGSLRIFPLKKENAGQMNVTQLKGKHDQAPIPVSPMIGKTYEAGPATWNDLFGMSHHQVLAMCQWHNDDMGIVQSQDLNQRHFAIAAWLTGRALPSNSVNDAAAAAPAAAVTRSPPARRRFATGLDSDSDQDSA